MTGTAGRPAWAPAAADNGQYPQYLGIRRTREDREFAAWPMLRSPCGPAWVPSAAAYPTGPSSQGRQPAARQPATITIRPIMAKKLGTRPGPGPADGRPADGR